MGPFQFSSPCLGSGAAMNRAAVLAFVLYAVPCHGFAKPAHGHIQPASYSLSNPLRGIASWYGGRHAGKPTASGEIHRTELRTAAHRHLPFGTIVKVTNLLNNRVSVVRVNDRGPFVAGRTIDLSERAARDLGMIDDGLAPVRLEILADE
jgi:rare lipoprotein A